jgi:hypothetical protein
MSNSDFEDRINRIRANSGNREQRPSRAAKKQMSPLKGIILGAIMTTAGGQLAKVANTNYETLRDDYGITTALGLGLFSLALLFMGLLYLKRGLFPARSAATYQSDATRPVAQTSAGARLFFSLFGLVLGVVACFSMYLSNLTREVGATGEVDTRIADVAAMGFVVITFGLVALALLIGLIGLFVRRLPLRRVPVFCLLGGIVLYVSFQNFGIHPTNWPLFKAEVIRSLNAQTLPQAGTAEP